MVVVLVARVREVSASVLRAVSRRALAVGFGARFGKKDYRWTYVCVEKGRCLQRCVVEAFVFVIVEEGEG